MPTRITNLDEIVAKIAEGVRVMVDVADGAGGNIFVEVKENKELVKSLRVKNLDTWELVRYTTKELWFLGIDRMK